MAREYNVVCSAATLGGAATMVFINPGSTCGVEILKVVISQHANATSAQQDVQLVTQVTAFPTLTSATPRPLKLHGTASQITGGTAGAAGTCGINASAEGAGAKTIVVADAFNVLTGWLWEPKKDERIYLRAASSSGFGVYLPTAPATLTKWNCTVTFMESD